MAKRLTRRGEILRKAREAVGLTQRQTAKAIGTGRAAVRAFEVEFDRVPSPDIAGRYAGVLEMRPAELAHVLGYLPAEDLETLRQAWGE